MEPSTSAVPNAGSSYAPDLRRRADELGELARAIERSLVMTLARPEPTSAPGDQSPTGERGRLCEAMLQRNLHQLHRAADDLRITAMRFRERADELDAAAREAA